MSKTDSPKPFFEWHRYHRIHEFILGDLLLCRLRLLDTEDDSLLFRVDDMEFDGVLFDTGQQMRLWEPGQPPFCFKTESWNVAEQAVEIMYGQIFSRMKFKHDAGLFSRFRRWFSGRFG